MLRRKCTQSFPLFGYSKPLIIFSTHQVKYNVFSFASCNGACITTPGTQMQETLLPRRLPLEPNALWSQILILTWCMDPTTVTSHLVGWVPLPISLFVAIWCYILCFEETFEDRNSSSTSVQKKSSSSLIAFLSLSPPNLTMCLLFPYLYSGPS